MEPGTVSDSCCIVSELANALGPFSATGRGTNPARGQVHVSFLLDDVQKPGSSY